MKKLNFFYFWLLLATDYSGDSICSAAIRILTENYLHVAFLDNWNVGLLPIVPVQINEFDSESFQYWTHPLRIFRAQWTIT